MLITRIYIPIFIHYHALDYIKHLLIKQSLILTSTKAENETTVILL